MNEERINLLLEKFGLKISVAGWKPFGHGHINDTFLVTTPGNKPDLILQRKNHLIFKDIAGMMSNIVLTTNHIRKKLMVEGKLNPTAR